MLLVGSPIYIAEIHQVLARESWLGYQVMGCLVPAIYAGPETTSAGVPVLGLIEDVRAIVDEVSPDIVFFTAGAVSSSTAAASPRLGARGPRPRADHRRPQRHRRLQRAGPSIRPVAGLPLMHLGRSRSQLATNDAKRPSTSSAPLLVLAAHRGRCCSP